METVDEFQISMCKGETHYTSRSAIEAYDRCPRLRYLTYHYNGIGLQPTIKYLPLISGTAVHTGIEEILKWVQTNKKGQLLPPQEVIDSAIETVYKIYETEIAAYLNRVKRFGYGEGIDSEKAKAKDLFQYRDQRAVAEALIRAFCLRVLPKLIAEYNILAVEQEEEVIIGREYIPGNYLYTPISLQGRVDAILQRKTDKNVFLLSLKTIKKLFTETRDTGELKIADKRKESSIQEDNQGLSETWLVEERFRQENNTITATRANLRTLLRDSIGNPLSIEKMLDYLDKQYKPEKIGGIKMIFLVKGEQKEDKQGFYSSHSPLVRGYRKLVGNTWSYAWELFPPSDMNESGKTRLGKGWEPFQVWNSDIGIQKWLAMLDSGKIQPDCGDPFEKNLWTPGEIYRREAELRAWQRQTFWKESRIVQGLHSVQTIDIDNGFDEMLDQYFPMHRHSCSYPVSCQMKKICYDDSVKADPIGSGLYQVRIPHHPKEAEQHRRLQQSIGDDLQQNSQHTQEQQQQRQKQKQVINQTEPVIDNEPEEIED